ncbi:tyrosinase-like [Mixophyes fleayi]|uniref:tyrosinase-like n=1 Tax=Mixophyes fleayi TaxID=3061075 RepID=UPI003F4DDD7C
MEQAMLLTSFLLLCLTNVNAMIFPKECLKDYPGVRVPCCPYYPDSNGSPCGAHLGRGSCVLLSRSRSMPPVDIIIDERHFFPSYFFNTTCLCQGNFWGYKCGECIFGYKGKNCDESYTVIRMDIRQVSLAKRKAYFAALNYCKHITDREYYILQAGHRFRSGTFRFVEASCYDVWCFNHYYATKAFINNTRENNIVNYAHASSGFLTWHRFALLLLERQLQKYMDDPYLALLYCDWRYDSGCEFCNNDFFGDNDDQGNIHPYSIFSTWRLVCGGYEYPETSCLMPDCYCERGKILRRPGGHLTITKSSAADVDYCLSLPNLDTPPYNWESQRSFRNCLEGFMNRAGRAATTMHNAFHVFCGGTMGEVPLSCNDPIFVCHHAFIDKILEVYIRRRGLTPVDYPPTPYYGQRGNECIQPCHACFLHRDMLQQSTTHGVDYSVYNGM